MSSGSGLGAVMSERRQLLNLTYRLLGSLAEAEDAVQETYARWYTLSRPLPEPGEWLHGGTDGTTVDPADRVTLDESVSMAFLVVLDSMTPAERVAFVLHDVFGYPFPEVARITGRSPAACRQLATSARRRVRAAQAPTAPDAEQASVVRDFKRAWEAQDIKALVGLLDPDATVIADGGGLVAAALHPIEGAAQIGAYLASLGHLRPAELTMLERTVNGQPGLILEQDGAVLTVFAFGVADGRITRIWAIRNPEKLRPWTSS